MKKVWVRRDEAGAVNGVYARKQPDAGEHIADDHQDVQDFLHPPISVREARIQEYPPVIDMIMDILDTMDPEPGTKAHDLRLQIEAIHAEYPEE